MDGLLVAISALWMTLLYQAQPGTGDVLYVLRPLFGSAMAACLVLGFAAVRATSWSLMERVGMRHDCTQSASR